MNFTINRELLLYLLGNIWHVADRKSSMRILSCILFNFSKKDLLLKVSATNIKTTIQQTVKIESELQEGFAVQAKAIYDVARVLPESEVNVERYVEDRIKITSGSFNARIPVLSEKEFPSLPEIKKTDTLSSAKLSKIIDKTIPEIKKTDSKKSLTLSSAKLSRIIDKTIFSISDDETRPYIYGALFEIEKGWAKMVTTDGHRMTIYKEECEESPKQGKLKILIPLPGLLELKRFLQTGEDELQMVVESNMLHFLKKTRIYDSWDIDLLLSIRLTDSDFPSYEAVIPKSNNRICIAGRQLLLEAIKRVSVLASERYRAMGMHFENNKLVLKAEYADAGETEEVVDVGFDSQPLTIGFNSTYVYQAINAIEGDQVEIRLGGELDGAIFKCVGKEDYMGIVMPVRL